jgi:hypothetical protein
MTPLLSILMRVLRAGAVGTAGLSALFLGIEFWKRSTQTGFDSMSRQDIGLFVILGLLLLGALWLARSITRELSGKSGT